MRKTEYEEGGEHFLPLILYDTVAGRLWTLMVIHITTLSYRFLKYFLKQMIFTKYLTCQSLQRWQGRNMDF